MVSLEHQNQEACQAGSWGGCSLPVADLQQAAAGRRDQARHPHRTHPSHPGSAFSFESLKTGKGLVSVSNHNETVQWGILLPVPWFILFYFI